MPRILFINPSYEDYLADGVFHGLRVLLGPDVIDFPKAEHMYDSASPVAQKRLRGHGFTLYGLLPDIPLERDHILTRALDGEFDLVIFGEIQTTFGLWTSWGPMLSDVGVPMAVIDGGDRPGPYPFAGRWWRKPVWWFLPRAHNRVIAYFKREITPRTSWYASYLLLPPPLGRGLGLQPTSFCIPEEKIVVSPPLKEKDLPAHVIDPELAQRLGRDTSYAFENEADYYADLQRSRFGITTKRAGWDALRHYEIAANGAVPCFRDLDRKPAGCGPHGLDDGNCLAYSNADDLLAGIESLSEARYLELQSGALAWARKNTTVLRAGEILTACGIALHPAGQFASTQRSSGSPRGRVG